MFLTPLLLQAAPHITAGERLLAPLAKLLLARGIEEADPTGHELHIDTQRGNSLRASAPMRS